MVVPGPPLRTIAATTAVAACVLGWPAAPPGATTAGSPGGGDPDGPEGESEVTISFSGDLQPLRLDGNDDGEVALFGTISLEGECRVTDGTLTAAGEQLDDSVSVEGSTAFTLAGSVPTLFVNALSGTDVATIRAQPDGTLSGTARVSDPSDEPGPDAFYRVEGTWTSSGLLPACVTSDPRDTRATAPEETDGEAVNPGRPRVTSAVPGPAGSGAVTVAYESATDWAPPTESALTPTAVVGVEYRVGAGSWIPVEAPAGRGGAFTVWGLEARAESRIEVRTVGSSGYSEPSEAVSVTPTPEGATEATLEPATSRCAAVPLPRIEIEAVDVSSTLETTVRYAQLAPAGTDLTDSLDCVASLDWSVAGDGVPDTLRHQQLDPSEESGTFTFSAFGLPEGTWTVTVDSTNRGNPYAESGAFTTFDVPGGPPAAPIAASCGESAPSVPSLTSPVRNDDGSHTVRFALSAPDGAESGDCTTQVSAWVPSAGIADEPVQLDGAGGSFTVPAELSAGVHRVSIAAANGADPRFTRAVGSALLAVPPPGSVVDLSVTYGTQRYAFATGAAVRVPSPAVLGATDPAFAPLAELPVGIFLDPQTGALFGTAVRPTEGALSVPIQVTDVDGARATAELTLEVADPGPGGDPGAGYPAGLWLPQGETVAITPLVDPTAAGTFSGEDPLTPVEPFSGTVLWDVPDDGADPEDPRSATTDRPAGSESGAEEPDDSTDAADDPADAAEADREVRTSVEFSPTATDEPVSVDLTATAYEAGVPVAFVAAEDGTCESQGPLLHRSRLLNRGSSVGLLPTLTGRAEPVSFAVTDGALPPGVTLDGVTGRLTGTPETAGTYRSTVAAEFSDSTRRVAEIVLEVTESEDSLAYPSNVWTVSGALFEAVPHISGEEVETLLSVVCGALPDGLRFDDRSGAILGQVGTTSEGGDAAGVGRAADPGVPSSVVIGADTESGLVTGSLVIAGAPEPLPQLAYPSEVAVTVGRPVEVPPSTADWPAEVTFGVANGSLPAGLRLRATTGELVGTAVRPSNPRSATVAATGPDGEVVAASSLRFVVGEAHEEGSRWWWLWFVVGAVAVLGSVVTELVRRARNPAA